MNAAFVWNDVNLAIDWSILAGEEPLLSVKDAAGASFNKQSEI